MAKAKQAKSKPTKHKAKSRTKGTLSAVGALLITSAVLRAAIGAGEAIAREEPAFPAEADMAETTMETAKPTADGYDKPATTGVQMAALDDSEILPLIETLNAREARIKKRESDMEVRMQALAVAEQEIERKLAALEEAEIRLRDTMALAQDAAEDDLSQLTSVYANMKPKQAAALFEAMDPQFAAGFLSRMKANTAAAIMAGLTPQAAYTISVVLAGRNAEVPKE